MAFQDIRKSRKWLSAQELGFLVLVLVVLVAVLVGNIFLARTVPGGEWFFLRWSGARAFLIEGIEPYSTEIAQRTQEVAYGRRAFSSEYAYVLNDPFFIVLLYTPLALLQNFFNSITPSLAAAIDFAVLRGIWMLLSQIALIAIVLLTLPLSEWQPPPWLYILLLFFGLFSYFSLNALVTGTPTILLTLLYAWILIALRSHADEWAGVLLSLVAYQWEVGGLYFLFILFFVLINHRWGVLAGFAMALVVLLAVSFLTDSDWGLPYIRAVLSDWYRGANLTLGSRLSAWVPVVRVSPGTIVSVGLGILLFAEWLASTNAPFRRVFWTACLSLAVTPLMGFAIFPSNHVVLILPFFLILALVWERWQRRRGLYTVLIFLLVLLIPFGLYLRSVTLYDPLITDLMAVLPPVAAIVGLYWMRWWVLRTPRTWSDRLGEYR
jgi:hypothetical protein